MFWQTSRETPKSHFQIHMLLFWLSSSFGLFHRFMMNGSRVLVHSMMLSKALWRSCWIFMGQFNDMKFKVVSSSPVDKTESESESGSHKAVRVRGKPPGSSDGKTRVRTVLNEKQLHTLRWVADRFVESINSFTHATASMMHEKKLSDSCWEMENWKPQK
jgi:hypothetical protein